MINVYEKDGVWYSEHEPDAFNVYSVNTAEPDYLTCYWKSDRHIVYKMHKDDLFGGNSILHCRLHEVMENRRKYLEK